MQGKEEEGVVTAPIARCTYAHRRLRLTNGVWSGAVGAHSERYCTLNCWVGNGIRRHGV